MKCTGILTFKVFVDALSWQSSMVILYVLLSGGFMTCIDLWFNLLCKEHHNPYLSCNFVGHCWLIRVVAGIFFVLCNCSLISWLPYVWQASLFHLWCQWRMVCSLIPPFLFTQLLNWNNFEPQKMSNFLSQISVDK